MSVPTRSSPRLFGGLVTVALLTFASCEREGATGPLGSPGLAPTPGPSREVVATSYTYTTDADFDEGTLVNLNHDTPNGDQLQLNTTSGTFPFIWVALSQRCTIAKVNTQTGAILGEYRTVADGAPCFESSRTTVSIDGSVWVGHRGPGGVAHVGLFELNQCVDRNGNGTIETSSGYGDVKPWPGGAPSDVAGAQDECILHQVNVTALGLGDSRHMSIDADNNLWVGSFAGGSKFVQLNGQTGAVESPVTVTPCGGYGGLIDSNGVIWSSHGGAALLRWDPNAPTVAGSNPRCRFDVPTYGLAVDQHGWVWANQFGNQVRKVSPDGNTVLGPFFNGSATGSQGLAVDGNGDVWISSSLNCNFNCTIGHLKNDGTFVGNVLNPTGSGSTGISVDADGMIWSANRSSHTATRINPNAGPIGVGGVPIGAVDLTVHFPATPGRPVPFPYNYSDMTGAQLFSNTAPQGSWTVVQDGEDAGAEWRTITWNTEDEGSVPAGGEIVVEARAADTQAALGAQTYLTVSNGTDFSLTGRFIQVRVTLKAGEDNASPVLSDLTVEGGDDVPPELSVSAGPGSLWPPNHKYHTITVSIDASDNRGDVTVTGYVVSSEPDDASGNGDGKTTGDIKVTRPDGTVFLSSNSNPQVAFGPGDTLELRAERAGGGGGRTYSIVLTATDAAGNTTETTATVTVPHDQS